MSVELGPGATVHVVPPGVPTVAAPPPSGAPTVVVPVVGPQGPPGPPGTPGDDPAGLFYEHTQDTPSTVWLITHGLPFTPAGVEVVDHTGAPHHPVLSWPAADTIRLDFDAPVRGVARLS